MTGRIRILLVDDHALIRGGLKAVLSLEQDMEVVGEAENGEQAVLQATSLVPDIVLMDLMMPLKDGIEAISDIHRQNPEIKMIVLTSFGETDRILLAVKCGALGYLLKNSPPEEILHAIREVHRGGLAIQSAITRQLFQRMAKYPDQGANSKLTEREIDILKHVARGLSNEDIATKETISDRTVAVHVSHILDKLNLTNRAQLVLYAIRHGLVSIFQEE